MKTTTCKLTFPDGATVEATVSVRSTHAQGDVVYSGAVDRLRPEEDIFKKGDGYNLMSFFQVAAYELGAEYSMTESGDYDFIDKPNFEP
jgi:hypothetical protein